MMWQHLAQSDGTVCNSCTLHEYLGFIIASPQLWLLMELQYKAFEQNKVRLS